MKRNEPKQVAIYTPAGAHSFSDEQVIRRAAVFHAVPCISTMRSARAAAQAVASRRRDPIRIWGLQEIHKGRKAPA